MKQSRAGLHVNRTPVSMSYSSYTGYIDERLQTELSLVDSTQSFFFSVVKVLSNHIDLFESDHKYLL